MCILLDYALAVSGIRFCILNTYLQSEQLVKFRSYSFPGGFVPFENGLYYQYVEINASSRVKSV